MEGGYFLLERNMDNNPNPSPTSFYPTAYPLFPSNPLTSAEPTPSPGNGGPCRISPLFQMNRLSLSGILR